MSTTDVEITRLFGGPGSGKTTALLDRVETILEDDSVDTRDILVVSYTRAAAAEIRERLPDSDVNVDVEAEAAVPEGSRPLLNDSGLAPGCVVEGVYVMPGIPEELKAMFASVADEFAGDRRSRFLYTVEPESDIVPALEAAGEQFDVAIGCYPDREAEHNRLKVTATDEDALDEAAAWLLANVDASETPVRRDWGSE